MKVSALQETNTELFLSLNMVPKVKKYDITHFFYYLLP